MKTSKEIRQEFIDFFLSKGHEFVPSSPVVPIDDPTLLFANAGMNQFKNIFLGLKDSGVKRAVNSQKCIRAGGKHNDLEDVGKDGYHQTFFEMLGNWSFGDYYKKEAITWAWELLTEVWELPKNDLYATVHHSDDEAFKLWSECTDIAPGHVSYHGDKDNFWEMGESGPCGPCSEIHIDRGPGHCDKGDLEGHVCEVNGGCARYIELWNLVFIQYNREADRSLTPLKNRFVDTGAGFERIVQVLQGKSSNYETDLFQPIIDQIAILSGVEYHPESGVSHRVVADHVRCLCFALADGGFPSNEGRGYVLRRILRRAARHGRLLGFREPFMFHLVDVVVGEMGDHFPELKGREAYIRMILKAEEERFNQTLDTGLERLEEICAKSIGEISGDDAFLLYDTYGFPLDLTVLLGTEKGLRVDLDGFNRAMDKQRERARANARFSFTASDSEWIVLRESSPTEFLGYELTKTDAAIQRFSVTEDGKVLVQLDKTVFYAESGGQVADLGSISNTGFEMKVIDVYKDDDRFIHVGELVRGSIEEGMVSAEIDAARRLDIARNHTATHLLHKALRSLLGEHVQQKGSLVAPDYLRFDFTHIKALTGVEVRQVETSVNEMIRGNETLKVESKSVEKAREEGAMALFGEKYADIVRVVSVANLSKELCGGTHVRATGEIGLFKVISESSSAAGIRRIEAVTGRGAEQEFFSMQDRLVSLAGKLGVPNRQIEGRIDSLIAKQHELEQAIKSYESSQSEAQAKQLLGQVVQEDDLSLLTAIIDGDAEKLRELGDLLRDMAKQAVSVLFRTEGDKVTFLCVIGNELSGRYHAGKIVGEIASRFGGKGGGRPDSAMGGGTGTDKLGLIMNNLADLIKNTK